MRIIDKLVEQWYMDTECKTPVHEYIGLTLAEYDDFSNHGVIPSDRKDLAQEYKKPDSSDVNYISGKFVMAVTPAKREV